MNSRSFTILILFLLLVCNVFSQGYADEVAVYRANHQINIGKLKISNETSKAITIFLYHPDSPKGFSYQVDLEVGESVYMKSNGNSMNVGSDWGYEVSLRGQAAYGGENVLFIGNDSNFNNEFNLKIGVPYGNWWEAPEETDDEALDLLEYYDEESCDYHTIAFSNSSGVAIKIWVHFVPQGKTAYETWVYQFNDNDFGVIGYTNMDFYWYAEEPTVHADGTYHNWKGDKHVEVTGQDMYMREEKLEGRGCEEIENIIW